MLKQFLIILLATQMIYSDADPRIKHMIEEISENLDSKVSSLDDSQISEDSIIYKIKTIDKLKSQGRVHKLFGLQENKYKDFLTSFAKTIKLPIEHSDLVKQELLKLTEKDDDDWGIFKYIYSKEGLETTEYICIFAQYLKESKKLNFVYTQISTEFKISQTLITQKVKLNDDDVVELGDIEVSLKPAEMNEKEADQAMTYFDSMAFKTLKSEIVGQKQHLNYLAFIEPTTFLAVLGNADKIGSTFKTIASAFKNSRSNKIKQRFESKGFDYYENKSMIQIINGIKAEYLNEYLDNLEKRLAVPADKLTDLKSILKEVTFADSGYWATANTLFSVDSKGTCKFVSILFNKNIEENKYNFIVNDIDTTFQFSPNILIVSKRLTVMGGLWDDKKDIIKKKPRSITQDDVDTIMNFFNVVAYKSFMKNMGYDVDEILNPKKKDSKEVKEDKVEKPKKDDKAVKPKKDEVDEDEMNELDESLLFLE
jgi:hypothetical protein